VTPHSLAKRETKSTESIGLKTASLFSGIGGFELGLEKNGHRICLLCEIDPAAAAVLSAQFPGIPITEDVRSLNEIPSEIDLVTMGFPCQDLSQVGTRQGISGQSSGLVFDAFTVFRKRPPRWLIIENVPFMLQLSKGEAIRRITQELETLGYRWAYRIIDARAFGIPQRRPRVFIVASLEDDPRTVLLSDNAAEEVSPEIDESRQNAIGFYWTEGNRGLGSALNSVPPLKGGSRLGIPSSPAILLPDGRVITLHISDAERLQGFPPNWTLPAEAVGARGARWRLVGNAVNVRVSEWLGRRLQKPKAYISKNDEPVKVGTRWPSSAYNVNGTTYAANVGIYPVRRLTPSICDFLNFESPPLSAKATRGLVSRLRKAPLRLPSGFLQALETHLARME
jgi:DNA (cytosine-5)-methyltransferase 1